MKKLTELTFISKETLKIKDYLDLLLKDQKISIDDHTITHVDKCYQFLDEVSVNKIIDGVNTGLGPMAQYRIERADQVQLQYNLIRSHAAGTGKPLDPICVRAAMISRLKACR